MTCALGEADCIWTGKTCPMCGGDGLHRFSVTEPEGIVHRVVGWYTQGTRCAVCNGHGREAC